MELKQYAAEHIIENGKHYPEKWVNRSFIEVADAQRALDAERARVKELQGAASTPINELLAELISCAGVFDVSTDYEDDRKALETATQAVLDHVATLQAQLRQVLEVEHKYRKELWLGHRHHGMYGDDGEMQCIECHPYGVTDYKRDPLDKVEHAAFQARIHRATQATQDAGQGGLQ